LKKSILLAVVLLSGVSGAQAQEVTIKLGTLAPVGSTWHELLKEQAEKWTQISGGKVKLRIYAGGTQGSEGDMVRKMAIGQLQAASITTVGMHDIVQEPQALTVPLMFDNQDELRQVFAKVQPKLEALLEKRGYVALQWSEVGRIAFFCTKAYQTPAEMAEAKVFAWEGDPAAVEAWKAAGFKPVVLSSTDIVPSLQTGMINCVNMVPLYALTARLFDKANYLMDVNWGYLLGATLVRKDAWDRIPADLRLKLIQVARELGQRIDAEIAKLNADAIDAMKKQGLNVVTVDQAHWRRAAEKAWPSVRGKVIPEAFFDEVKRERDAVRAARK
jgi:TRAP-type transport system periplasmic protein